MARRAFVHAALELNELWGQLPQNIGNPIAQVLRARR